MKKLVVFLFLLGFLIRAGYFLYPLERTSFFTVDEAIYGVQSLRILEGDHPVFYPAQVYTGSLSAYFAALLYFLFGFHAIFLKLVPFVFSLLFIFLNYKLALNVFRDKSYALITLLLTSLATPFWNNWASRAGTGYVEASAIGSVMLLISLNLVSTELITPRKPFLFFLLGFLSGLGFWVQPTIIYYILPIIFFLLFTYKGLLKDRIAYLAPLGYILGNLPVIIYNLNYNGATTRTLFKLPWGVKTAFIKLISEGIPVIVGVRTSNSTRNFFTPLAVLILLILLGALFYFSKVTLKSFSKRLAHGHISLVASDLIFLTLFSTLALFLISTPFNQFSIEPRYLFSLYSTLPLILAFFLVRLWKLNRVIFMIVLLLYTTNWILGVTVAGPTTFNDNYRVEDLAKYLKDNSFKDIISDPSLGHRVMFYSNLSVLSAVRGGGITEWRFPDINQKVITTRDLDNFSVSFIALKDSTYEKDFKREIDSFVDTNFEKLVVDNTFVILKPVRK